MKLTAKIRLDVTAEQRKALLHTLEAANDCCNWISGIAWEKKEFAQYSLQKLVYHEARQKFPLSAQIVVRVLAKVADAYKLDRKRQRRFAKHGAISYDSRILRYKEAAVSIWTTEGRQDIPYSAGEGQKNLLKSQQGESDLIYHRDKFYLAATCDIPDPPPSVVDDFLGVDMGIVLIATDSDGDAHSGCAMNNVRYRHRKLRGKLQSNGSRSAKRHLKKLSGKESRFAQNLNHTIAKEIVDKAKRTGRGIAIETLTGILGRVRARRDRQAILHSWSFAQLGAFLKYKAVLAGVPLEEVDPRNSSRECSQCAHTDKSNRPSQSKFRCRSCNYTTNADFNAARNISSRAVRQAANRNEACKLSHGLVISN